MLAEVMKVILGTRCAGYCRLGGHEQLEERAELAPLFSANIDKLDTDMFGFCVDVRYPIQAFLVETPLVPETSWVN